IYCLSGCICPRENRYYILSFLLFLRGDIIFFEAVISRIFRDKTRDSPLNKLLSLLCLKDILHYLDIQNGKSGMVCIHARKETTDNPEEPFERKR
uniref:Uncharacterized protein n=1 Tax=Aegilops tauschii subsp. strangulata TaxID=200361 RepID=A0A453RFN6_AEGTS